MRANTVRLGHADSRQCNDPVKPVRKEVQKGLPIEGTLTPWSSGACAQCDVTCQCEKMTCWHDGSGDSMSARGKNDNQKPFRSGINKSSSPLLLPT